MTLAAWSGAALAQPWSDPLNLNPRGLTELPPRGAPAQPAAAASAVQPAVPAQGGGRFDAPQSGAPPAPAREVGPMAQPLGTRMPAGPPPVDPATSTVPVVFGSQLFSGRFGLESFTGFNAQYQISVGDRISIRMWGAFPYDSVQSVDAQGNVFVPNVGPIKVVGLPNRDLNQQVEAQVKRVFRANVGVYAALEAAQPIKVYVTGFVRAPGLYAGVSSDSILGYIDKANGIDPDRGSFLLVDLLRGGQLRTQINLYEFLLAGQIPTVQLQDGDVIVVAARRATVQVSGAVQNPYIFEFAGQRLPATQLLQLARPRPEATHMSIVRKVGAESRREYFSLKDAGDVPIEDGDEVTFTSDKYPGTILVRVEGAQLGQRTLVLPYGAAFGDALKQIRPAPQANLSAMQLFRRSVADRQRQRLEDSLRSLETYALTARSSTSEEAALRSREADLILQFVARARSIQPKGQVILTGSASEDASTLLEDGDVIRIPERSNLVLVSGEVTFPHALIWESGSTATDYVTRAGGYTQDADKGRIVVLSQDGSVVDADERKLMPGDEILVLPRVQTKNIEVTRGITQIIYQIAVAAKVALGL